MCGSALVTKQIQREIKKCRYTIMYYECSERGVGRERKSENILCIIVHSNYNQFFISSSLNRVLEPSVLMEMQLTNGHIKTFEVQKFLFIQNAFQWAWLLHFVPK